MRPDATRARMPSWLVSPAMFRTVVTPLAIYVHKSRRIVTRDRFIAVLYTFFIGPIRSGGEARGIAGAGAVIRVCLAD